MNDTHSVTAKGIESFIGNADEFPVLRHWNFFNHRQHFMFPNFHRNRVGIAISHQTGCRTAASHAEAS